MSTHSLLFLSRNTKNNVYPCKPQFYYKKWGLRGSKLYWHVFVMTECTCYTCYIVNRLDAQGGLTNSCNAGSRFMNCQIKHTLNVILCNVN